MKRFHPVFPLTALLLTTMGAGACDSPPLGSTDGGARSCRDGAKTYASGTTFPSTDGCNTCSCADGSVACTTRGCALDGSVDASADAPAICADANGNVIACPTDAGIPCTYQGKDHPPGSTFPSYDGCNSCSCAGGQVVCTEKACADAGPPIDASTDGPPICNGSISNCPNIPGPVCTPGADQTCNEDPTINSLRGKCLPDGTCACGTNAVSPYTGRCLNPGDKTGDGCEYAGVLQPVGSSFSCADGCNKCACTSSGQVGMTAIACPVDAGGPACSFDSVYVYGDTGGLVRYSDQVTLTPPASYVFVRAATPGGSATGGSCAPTFPACGQPGEIDVSDVMNDIADPTVQLLLSLAVGQPTPALLGIDSRPFDGSVFSFKRGGGSGFLVGQPCAGEAGCTAIPAAVTRLVGDLRSLDQLQLKDSSCLAFTAKP
jgi:hypothetical protein